MFTTMKHLMLAGIIVALPASLAAQTAEQPAQTTTEEAPAATDQPVTEETEAPAATDQPVTEETEAPPAAVQGQIVLQSEDTILADDLIGSSVYSDNGTTVGDIADLIINLDGSVEGVVIGVGGFLGIGEKHVAVQMDTLSLYTDAETGTLRLMLSATREDLEAAPAFKSAAEQKFEAESQESQQNLNNGLAPTDSAPAGDKTGS